MATTCCSTAAARRLSDLLNEQQEEPLLLLHLLLQDHDDDDDIATPARTLTSSAAASARTTRNLLRGSTAATKLALRWADDVLAGCFSFPCAATRQRLRRLPRADRLGDDVVDPADSHDRGAGDCGRQQQLSPVSVLDLHSDDESSSPVPSHRDDEHGDDDGNGKASTSGTGTSPSPPPPSIHDLPGRTPTTEEKFQRKSAVCSWEWESVAGAADISRIPRLVELDLSASPRDDWRRLVVVGGEEEARQVARSIEAMIFEEVRWETVHDMLCLTEH